MIYLQWLLYFIPAFLLEVLGWLVNPIAALFVTKRERTDKAKRLGSGQHAFEHEYLQKYVYWFQTHDNACDEYWYGMFNEDSAFSYIRDMTQEKYDNSRFARYAMRLLWIYRNNAYGLLYNLLGKPDRREDVFNRSEYGIRKVSNFWYRFDRFEKSGFQFEAHVPILPNMFGYRFYNDVNVGWKDHRSAVKCLYANRVLGIRIRKLNK